jgi:colanic acid/amylovoran biosynthesis protein
MKKIMIYAYTQFNLGDDLFIKILCERYPKTKFVLLAPRKYKLCFKELENIKFYSSDSIVIRGINYILGKVKKYGNFRKILANRCDAIVQIGGSLFMEGKNWWEQFDYTKNSTITGKPYFLLGANFGPFKDKEYYYKHKELFENYTDICFREKYSFNLFKDLSNVRMADDIIFQIKKQDFNEQDTNNIVISVIKPSYRESLSGYDKIYYSKIKEIAIYFIERGFEVTLMSFCEFEGDNEAVDNIIKSIPNQYLEKLKKHYYTINIEQTIYLISSSSFVVASRFHAMILGWVFNKPVFPIVYSNKMINVMDDVGFNGLYTDYTNIDNIEPEQVFNSFKNSSINVSNQVKSAEKHFEKLDEFLLN